LSWGLSQLPREPAAAEEHDDRRAAGFQRNLHERPAGTLLAAHTLRHAATSLRSSLSGSGTAAHFLGTAFTFSFCRRMKRIRKDKGAALLDNAPMIRSASGA
jgi:hypothetical protein